MKLRTECIVLGALVFLGVLAGLVGVKARFAVEQRNTRTEIVVDYADALNLALAARKPLDQTLRALRSQGVTTLALWEDSLDDLRLNGAMSVRADNASQTSLSFSPDFPGEESRVVSALANKTSVPYRVSGETIIAQAPYGQISALGIGLDPDQVNTTIRLGFLVSPRLFNYSGASPASIQWMLNQVKAQCRGRANVVIFNGPDVLGDRGEIDSTAASLRSDGLLYGSLELGKQVGDDELSRKAADITVRVHSIGGNEMPAMDEPTAVARFALAARERNIRSCYVRLFQNGLTDQPDIMAANLGYIGQIVGALRDGGMTIGAAHPFQSDPRPNRILLVLMGFAAAAGAVLVLRIFVPLVGGVFWVVLIVSILVGGALAAVRSMIGREIDALITAMAFPTLGLIFNRPTESEPSGRSLFWAIELAFRRYALMAATTIVGIILVVGLLADRLMLLKVYEFVGIRLAIITPFLLYLLYEGLGLNMLPQFAPWADRKRVALRRWSEFTASPLLMGQLIFGFVVLVILGIVVLRSGNDPGVGVSSSELSFRALLNRILYVRPRTKEIFFGYPLLFTGLALYYTGRRRWYPLFALAGAIGLADLQNTFCHLHTPLLISFIRALLGWIIGLAIGVALFLVVNRFAPRREQRNDSAGEDRQSELPTRGSRATVKA